MNFLLMLTEIQFLFKFHSRKTSDICNHPTINKKYVFFPITFNQE